MSILASLVRACERLPDAPPYGFSAEKIGFLISLNDDGSVATFSDLRVGEGRKLAAPLMFVPQPVKRTAGIAPNFLWDKSSYVLGLTAGEGKRTSEEHDAFVKRHASVLADSDDIGLLAMKRFLEAWRPELFEDLGWPDEMKDQNIVFSLEVERLACVRIHDRRAAKELWQRLGAEGEKTEAVCLVTGEKLPISRLHPAVKGVWGAQSSGASIVSFNLDAFTSYGHEQGDNAPVSEGAAFAYTTALNRFLQRDSGHRLQIGDASTVFWADAEEADKARLAEAVFEPLFDDETADDLPDIDESGQAAEIGEILRKIREGLPVRSFRPDLADKVRFFVLGLSPNAARLSVRFYLEDDFGEIAGRYQRFLDELRIKPGPRETSPAIWRYLREIALLGKSENIPPNQAGDWMRAILSGTRYPMTLLSSVLMRIRADGDVNALRVGLLKAMLIRNYQRRDVPVALEPDCPDKGYQLGRLFAVYERIQSDALGPRVNATVKDKFYGAASAQPRKVFSLLDSNAQHHLSKLGKQSPGRRVQLERLIGEIMDRMSPGNDPFPASFGAQEQALFGLGYYHQRNEFFKSHKNEAPAAKESAP
jgi:CRISPR-associated protein Csd1